MQKSLGNTKKKKKNMQCNALQCNAVILMLWKNVEEKALSLSSNIQQHSFHFE